VTEDGSTYSGKVAFVYIFNLVVGFGPLTLPHVFYESGYALATGFMLILGFVAYTTATFVIEAMSIGNALIFLGMHTDTESVTYEHVAQNDQDGAEENGLEDLDGVELVSPSGLSRKHSSSGVRERASTSLDAEEEENGEDNSASLQVKLEQNPFELRQKLELGEMAKIFLGSRGYRVLVFVTAVYLYGDLAIYACASPTTLIALYPGNREYVNLFFSSTPFKVNQRVAFQMWLGLFSLVVVPLSCMNFQKTKHLQLFTCTYRNIAIFSMIAIGINRYIKHGQLPPAETHEDIVVATHAANFASLPKLFGAATYSFMCHHSLPSIVFPIAADSRRNIMKIIAADYVAILSCYLLLCITAFFAFGTWLDRTCLSRPNGSTCSIHTVYIINFSDSINAAFGDFLTLLPVFICVTNYPLIAITTRNNLIFWFEKFRAKILSAPEPSASSTEIKLWHSLLVAVPPIIIALIVQDVSIIVEFTGSYAGLALEFVFPCWLVVMARRRIVGTAVENVHNDFSSPFRRHATVQLVMLWTLASLVFILIEQLLRFFGGPEAVESLTNTSGVANSSTLLVDNNDSKGVR